MQRISNIWMKQQLTERTSVSPKRDAARRSETQRAQPNSCRRFDDIRSSQSDSSAPDSLGLHENHQRANRPPSVCSMDTFLHQCTFYGSIITPSSSRRTETAALKWVNRMMLRGVWFAAVLRLKQEKLIHLVLQSFSCRNWFLFIIPPTCSWCNTELTSVSAEAWASEACGVIWRRADQRDFYYLNNSQIIFLQRKICTCVLSSNFCNFSGPEMII